jgi:putative inorganic carbon (HCO3(-)) transporter
MEQIKHRVDEATFFLTMLAVILPVISIAASQILLFLAFLSFSLQKSIRRETEISFPPLKAPLLLFMVSTLVAYVCSPEPEIGSPPIRKFVLFVIIILVVNGFSEHRLAQTYRALFLVGFIAAGFSIYQYFFLTHGVATRLVGFMGHWMTLSGEMMLVFVALAAYVIFANPSAKLLWWMALGVVGLSLALTLTRSVWIATIAGLLTLLWMRYYHWKSLVATAISLVLLLIIAPKLFRERMWSIFDSQNPSNYARLAIWKAGFRMIEAHPWVGVGPQRVSKVFYDYHPNSNDRYRDGFFPVHMHNNLLQFAAERGIPCALAWLWLILKIAWDHWRGFRGGEGGTQIRTIYVIGFISVVVLFLAGLFEFNFGDSEVLMIFLFLVSAPYAVVSSKAQSEA